jgi:hypothetical protein
VISGPVAAEATRLARLVAWLGDGPWSADLAALAGAPDAPEPSAAAPTYGDVARAGTGLVAALAGGGRWADAVVQSRHLKRFFTATGMDLGPIAAQAFDGLLAASLARDPDELGDFVELVAEMFT